MHTHSIFSRAARLRFSDAVGPEELLGDGAVGDVAEVFQERALLQVDIHTVAEARMTLAEEHVLLDAERVFDGAAALFEARQRRVANLLRESQRTERVLDLPRFRHQFFRADLLSLLSNGLHWCRYISFFNLFVYYYY